MIEIQLGVRGKGAGGGQTAKYVNRKRSTVNGKTGNKANLFSPQRAQRVTKSKTEILPPAGRQNDSQGRHCFRGLKPDTIPLLRLSFRIRSGAERNLVFQSIRKQETESRRQEEQTRDPSLLRSLGMTTGAGFHGSRFTVHDLRCSFPPLTLYDSLLPPRAFGATPCA